MRTWKKKPLALLGAGLLIAGAAIPFVAHGQEQVAAAPATPTTVVQPHARRADKPGKPAGQHGHKGGFVADLAGGLGLPEDKVREAMRLAREQAFAATIAPVVGLSADQVKAKLEQGKTVAQIGADQGKNRDTLRSALLSAKQVHLDKATKRGKFTADQAAQIRQSLAQKIERLLDRSFQPKAAGQAQGGQRQPKH